MQDARALLDDLMGPSRDRNPKEEKGKNGEPEFAAPNICKWALVGFCPQSWFTVNKRQLEPCRKNHSEYYKKQFDAYEDKEKYVPAWEDDFLAHLEKLVVDCDKYIARERIKCREKGAGGKRVILPSNDGERVAEMEARYAKLIKEAEEKAEESVTRAGELTEQAQALREQIEGVKARHTHEFPGEEVCEVCGVRYAMADSAQMELHGKESHLNGKTHEGYTEIRRKVIELREKKRLRDREKCKTDEAEREKEKERKDRDRDRDRGDRDRDRDRRGDRGRRDRSRRGRSGSGSRRRPRDRSPRRSRSRGGGGGRRDRRGRGRSGSS